MAAFVRLESDTNEEDLDLESLQQSSKFFTITDSEELDNSYDSKPTKVPKNVKVTRYSKWKKSNGKHFFKSFKLNTKFYLDCKVEMQKCLLITYCILFYR